MTAEPLPTRENREARRHPLLGACVIVHTPGGQLLFAGEILNMIRTGARNGDAALVKEFERSDGFPIEHKMIASFDLSSEESTLKYSLFDDLVEARDFIAARFPGMAGFYVLPDDEEAPL
jgi:hypothetical protein